MGASVHTFTINEIIVLFRQETYYVDMQIGAQGIANILCHHIISNFNELIIENRGENLKTVGTSSDV